MEQALNIIGIIAFVLFIIVQVYDLFKSIRFYKRIEADHKRFIENLREEYNNEND